MWYDLISDNNYYDVNRVDNKLKLNFIIISSMQACTLRYIMSLVVIFTMSSMTVHVFILSMCLICCVYNNMFDCPSFHVCTFAT